MQRASSLLRFFASGAMYYRVVFALLLIASCIAGAFASNECNVKAIARADLNLERVSTSLSVYFCDTCDETANSTF